MKKRTLPWFAMILFIVSVKTPSIAGNRQIDSGEFLITCGAETSSGTQITVVDKKLSREIYSALIPDVYSRHYHPVEFHNGNLYVIQRTGGSDGYSQFPDTWNDQLWRYDRNKKGVKLFENRGLCFSVTPNEKVIVITDGSAQTSDGGHLIFLSPDGVLNKTLNAQDVNFEDWGDLFPTDNSLFISEGGPGSGFHRLLKVNFKDMQSEMIDLSHLKFDSDYSFNPRVEKVIGSDAPVLYDVESAEEWRKGNPKVTLRLYDIESKKVEVISTSIAKGFSPKWLDDHTIEYNDPKSGSRVSRKIN